MNKAQKLTSLYRVISNANPEKFNIVLPWTCVKGHACENVELRREGLREDNFVEFFELTAREFCDLYSPSTYYTKHGAAARREALLKIQKIASNIVFVVQMPQREGWPRPKPKPKPKAGVFGSWWRSLN